MPDKTPDRQRSRSDRFKLHCFPSISSGAGSSTIPDAGKRPDGFRLFQSKGGRVAGEESGSADVSAEKLAALEAQARQREQEARASGYAEGEKAGMEMGRQAVAPVVAQLRQTLVELEKLKKQLVAKAEAEAVTLAMAIGRKIVLQEIRTDPQVVRNTVRAALEKVVERDGIRIRVHPEDMAAVQADGEDAYRRLGDEMASVTFEADPGIDPGGCLVETRFGDIDARIDNQLQWLEELFMAELRKASAQGPGKGS